MCSLLLFWEQVDKKLTVREKFKKEEVCEIRVVDKKTIQWFSCASKFKCRICRTTLQV